MFVIALIEKKTIIKNPTKIDRIIIRIYHLFKTDRISFVIKWKTPEIAERFETDSFFKVLNRTATW